MKLNLGKLKRLAVLTILVAATILIGGCVSVNKYPVISSLDVEKDWVIPSGSCNIECIASDENGDSLDYTWSATAGTISGTGSTATWMAPDTLGTYAITVKVTDGRGGEITGQRTMYVSVSSNQPPVIESLTTEWQKVGKAKSSTIRCFASDPNNDSLIYIWSVDGGNISGEGAKVTWTAPNAYGTYTITVTSTDGRGGEDSKSIHITVCACPGAGS